MKDIVHALTLFSDNLNYILQNYNTQGNNNGIAPADSATALGRGDLVSIHVLTIHASLVLPTVDSMNSDSGTSRPYEDVLTILIGVLL